MAFTEIYVDPSIDADSGSGTIGDPYGDLEYCFEQQDKPAAPTRVNIKAGTAEFPAAQVAAAMADTSAGSKSTAWTPTRENPLQIEGYTSAAGDGGIAEIDCGGDKSFISDGTLDFVSLRNLEIHNFGANIGIVLDRQCAIYDCVIYDSGNQSAMDLGDRCEVIGCYVTEFGVNGIDVSSYGIVMNNYVLSGTGQPGANGINCSLGTVVSNNIIKVRDVCSGTRCADYGLVANNSIYSAGGTGIGINILGATAGSVINNIVEGFSGSGGQGFNFDGATSHLRTTGGNAAYDNETNYVAQDTYTLNDLGDNEVLTESPFTDAANADFSVIDTGNVIGGSVPDDYANGNV